MLIVKTVLGEALLHYVFRFFSSSPYLD